MEPLVDIPLDAISPSPSNPRRRMEPPALDELAASIRAQGIIEPILVRPTRDGAPTPYELVVGERRWRAARLADLSTIRAQVREMDDRAVLEVQIAENAQRADVHPLDEADAYRRLHVEHRVEVEVSDVPELARVLARITPEDPVTKARLTIAGAETIVRSLTGLRRVA